jgi:regulator of PEP synthase PpsR (kinase-PPPase family)
MTHATALRSTATPQGLSKIRKARLLYLDLKLNYLYARGKTVQAIMTYQRIRKIRGW